MALDYALYLAGPGGTPPAPRPGLAVHVGIPHAITRELVREAFGFEARRHVLFRTAKDEGRIAAQDAMIAGVAAMLAADPADAAFLFEGGSTILHRREGVLRLNPEWGKLLAPRRLAAFTDPGRWEALPAGLG